MSGSYPAAISESIHDSIVSRDYDRLLRTLKKINVGYLMVTDNIPSQVKGSYLFDGDYITYQDQQLIKAITDKEVLKSKKGNYRIYKLKNNPRIISSEADISYNKINSTKYKITISSLKSSRELFFYETFHPGWKIYQAEGKYGNGVLQNLSDIVYLFNQSFFGNSHQAVTPYGNEWIIDPSVVKNKFTNYKQNKDGSIDVTITLYFLPQSYFYLGCLMTCLSLLIGLIFLTKYRNHDKN